MGDLRGLGRLEGRAGPQPGPIGGDGGGEFGVQAELVDIEPDRFFRPPYVGGRGWIAVRMDVKVDWDEIARICEDAYRQVAPARLVELLGGH